jgi:hypothetical protein
MDDPHLTNITKLKRKKKREKKTLQCTVIPLPFQHLLHNFFFFHFFHFGSKNKNILKFIQLRWLKRMPSNFALFGHSTTTPSFRAGRQSIEMAHKFLELLGIVSQLIQHCEAAILRKICIY